MPAARKLAEANGVDIRYYSIIYDAVDEVKGHVRDAGARKARGTIGLVRFARSSRSFPRSAHGRLHGHRRYRAPQRQLIRLLRDSVVIWTGELDSLKRFKDDVREVRMASSAV
jgi:translation initiation factor IF-2